MKLTLREIQDQVAVWSRYNFGDQTTLKPILGVMEELGELCHAVLKAEQEIRTDEDHRAQAIDAIGDLLIFLLDFAGRRGIDVEESLEVTWAEVSKRDWVKYPKTGLPRKDET